MIKNQAYIRKFTPRQKALLEEIATAENIKSAKDVFLFLLEAYPDMKNEIARLNRIIQYKQKKIDTLRADTCTE
ncbi:hypothetical protein [Flavobacterium rhizosphaerae]|uniref:Transposase n=1 Tax=Flavobacterium rhizosphaerae TaxID=3163298 RepID=A0ABW8YZ20_9FLAO